MVQGDPFSGYASDSAHGHLETFEKLLSTVHFAEADGEAIRLRLFSFSLKHRASDWYNSLQARSITTWEQLVGEFLKKFFPLSKINELRGKIKGFKQEKKESLDEAWDRFKGMLRTCPDHGCSKGELVLSFYNGVLSKVRYRLNAGAGGDLLNLGVDDAWDKIEYMAQEEELYPEEEEPVPVRRVANVEEVPAEEENVEEANFIRGGDRRSPPRRQPYQTNYRQEQHPANNARQGVYQPPQKRATTTDERLDAHIKKSDEHFGKIEAWIKDLGLGMRDIHKQVGQISSVLAERTPGALPSDTEKNPKEQCKAVTLRSGKELKPKEKEASEEQKDEEASPARSRSSEQNSFAGAKEFAGAKDAPFAGAKGDSPLQDENHTSEPPYVPPPTPPIRLPFPLAHKKNIKKEDKSFEKIFATLREVHINIPLLDAIVQMPSYAKFFKDILSKKRQWIENETVCLTEACSAVLLKHMPRKRKDPGSIKKKLRNLGPMTPHVFVLSI